MGTPLQNQRHERFAQVIATGKHAVEAYRAVAGSGKAGEREMGSRWLTRVDVQRRVAEIVRASATTATMTVTERREIAAEIARDKTLPATVRLHATVIEAKHAGEFMAEARPSSEDNRPLFSPDALAKLPAIFFKPRIPPRTSDSDGNGTTTNAQAGER